VREDNISEHAKTLRAIRKKWAIWTTPYLQERLAQFEHALFRIASLQRQLRDTLAQPHRQEIIHELMRLQIQVFGWDKWATGEASPSDISIEAVTETLKDVLGTNELNQIRADLIKQASESVSTNAAGGLS
jgi:hypothetical protein